MSSVELMLPEEITGALPEETERERDISSVTLAIDGLAVASSIITVTTLRRELPDIARGLRRWASNRGRGQTTTLYIKGPKIELSVELPPNVSTRTITEAINQVLNDEATAEPGKPTRRTRALPAPPRQR